jgi:hypothetical protein
VGVVVAREEREIEHEVLPVQSHRRQSTAALARAIGARLGGGLLGGARSELHKRLEALGGSAMLEAREHVVDGVIPRARLAKPLRHRQQVARQREVRHHSHVADDRLP